MTVLSAQEAYPAREFSILTVHGLIEVGQWERSFDDALYTALNGIQNEHYSIARHYFGTDEADNDEELARALENLRFTIERQQFDLAILVLPAITRLTLPHLDDMFPGIPIIFALPGDTELEAISRRADSYVVLGAGTTAIRDTLRSIPDWMPDLRGVVAVTGVGLGDSVYIERARPYLDELSGHYDVEVWAGLPLAELLDRVAALNRRTAIMFLTYDKSNDGVTYRTIDVLEDIAPVSGAPIFSFYDTLLGVGVTGGVMSNAEAYGQTVAEVAVAVLNGESQVATERMGETRIMFDDRALRRFGIRRHNLPPESEILYTEPNIFRDHPGIVATAIVVIIAQSSALLLLVLSHNRRKRVEAALRESVREKELLLREIHHRVKNNLQVVGSILEMHSRAIHDPEAMQSYRETSVRIQSMGLLHNKLYASRGAEQVDIQEYFEAIAEHIVQSYAAADRITYQMKCAGVYLNVETASPCGLILTELMTNSLKYAFPDGRPGTITVSLRGEPPGYLLVYTDDGVGLPPDFNSSSHGHVGLQIVNALVMQLHGTLESSSAGAATFAVRFEPVVGEFGGQGRQDTARR